MATEALGLGLGIGWPRERVGNAFQTRYFPDLESELKLSEVTVPVVLWLRSGLKYSVIISKVGEYL